MSLQVRVQSHEVARHIVRVFFQFGLHKVARLLIDLLQKQDSLVASEVAHVSKISDKMMRLSVLGRLKVIIYGIFRICVNFLGDLIVPVGKEIFEGALHTHADSRPVDYLLRQLLVDFVIVEDLHVLYLLDDHGVENLGEGVHLRQSTQIRICLYDFFHIVLRGLGCERVIMLVFVASAPNVIRHVQRIYRLNIV